MPRLAEIFGLSVDELLKYKAPEAKSESKEFKPILALIFQALTVAMGVVLIVSSILKEIDVYDGFIFVGVGLLSAGQWMLMNNKKD